MKARIAALVLLTATAGSASANGGDVLAGAVVGAVIGSAIGSSYGPPVSVQYGTMPPPVVYGPPPVYGPPAVVSYGYAPPPPVIGYAPPPPVAIYPAPRVYYGPPAWRYAPSYGGYYRYRDRDEGYGRGHWHGR